MDKNIFEIKKLKDKISNTEKELMLLNVKIRLLSSQLQNKNKGQNSFVLKDENENLQIIHESNETDILLYQTQIDQLENSIKINNDKILKLQKEKEKLEKHEKSNSKVKTMLKKFSTKIKGVGNIFDKKDKINSKEENEQKENNNLNNKSKNKKKKREIKEIKKQIKELESNFNKLKEKCNQYHIEYEQYILIGNNLRGYLNEVNQNMNIYKERLNISASKNNSNKNYNLKDINNHIYKILDLTRNIEKIIFDIKNYFGDYIENLLNETQQNLKKIDNNKYENNDNLNDIINDIEDNIEDIQNLCNVFEVKNTLFMDINKNIEKEINILNGKFVLLNKQIEDNQNNNIKIKEENNNKNIIIEDNKQYIPNNNDLNLSQSFLIKVKDKFIKCDTKILFSNKEEEELIENLAEVATLFRKNWHEICYVYDDYDIHDIFYEMKAVGLSKGSYFPNGMHSFFLDTIVNIQSFSINGKETKYTQEEHSIKFVLNLKNLEKAKIHIIYKEYKDLKKLTIEEIEERKVYKTGYYGLWKDLAGKKAKYRLILKGNYEIVEFSDYFLVKNKKNTKENEYYWGGVVPSEGKRTSIRFSKKKAIWSFSTSIKIKSENNINIKNTTLYLSNQFIGGNNEIIEINAKSNQTKDITFDKIKREYIANFKDINEKEAEFIVEGKLQNKCKGEWVIDLTDKEIDEGIPECDKLCKNQLKKIAENIIKEFDENNKNSKFEFLDYMKIALWVHKNIKYDYKYLGKNELSAMDIYNKKIGVCHHFTKLSNALLYSLGYKVIYISGFVSKNNKEFDKSSAHGWSLIKIDNKWYPFDSTWGIISGKLPVTHIFCNYFGSYYNGKSFDKIEYKKMIEGKYIS